MRKSTIYLYVLGIAVVITAALVSTGLIVSAQNSNSSTTMQADNMNTAKPKRKSRRHKPKTTEPAADTGMAAEAMQPATPRRTGRCDPMQQEQTDLSGTYTGRLRHGDDVKDATLTITGNNFTMTSGADTHSGRITAVTTCGYTAVTVMHGDMGAAATAPGATPPPPNKAMSLRAKKRGDSLTLTSVPGEPEKVMFTSGGGATRPRKQRTRKAAPPPPATTPPEQ